MQSNGQLRSIRLSGCGRLTAVFVLLFLAGCNPARDNLLVFNNIYQAGQLDRAGAFSRQHVKEPVQASGDNLLWSLQLAAVERSRQDYESSNLWFDRSEEMMKTFDMQMRQADIIGTTIVNDNLLPYRGQAYDGIMVNTFKALNFMKLGNNEYARVEFNRALERQIRAREKFNEEIQREQERLDRVSADGKMNYSQTTGNPDVQNRLMQAYPGLYAFEAYPDFVNPFATYLAGVFFLAVGDIGRARDLLRESAGMLPDNKYVQADFAAAEKALGSGRRVPPRVWVFFENGLGPVKQEYRIDLPLFLVTGEVYYAGIALPMLVKRQPAGERLTIYSQGRNHATQIVGDMDRVIQTEFAKDYPWILARALISAGVKAAAQHYVA
ncbi:MAG TPA: hypothetical protein VLH60_07730, partial [Sedimentisphaerales bacterium]|nr:hypothetical protein [Sedimentisphaerales bacterium]